jgi:hypothetical protein
VAARGEGGRDDLSAQPHERADGVAHHRGTGEQFGERVGVVGHLDHLVVDRVDAGHPVDHGLGLGPVAARGDEGDVELAQVLTDKATGVAGCAVDK